ncbi:MAG: Sb-PDE family phosphodiesterase [Bryobacterales bacterium]|nr:Sb-PDE family phosphodiesterase [Bryobacteraceae bacterium]MDW8129978.1 Sb-PDE family phosphodiesterase [Bryobacterales bacterium]
MTIALRRPLLLLVTALAAAQVRDPLPVPDLPGYRTLKCDFHTHTVFSDGQVWPTLRVLEAWRDGLDVIALSDHIDYQPHKDDVRVQIRRPYELARATAEQLGLLLVPAFEIARGDIHFNVLFVTDFDAFRGLDQAGALRVARQQNAFVFWNHPGWRRPKAEWLPIVDEYYREKLFQGLELINGPVFYPEAFPWIEEKNLTLICNTDVHGLTAWEYPNRTRAITLVFAAAATLDAVKEALMARRTVGWQGENLWGSETYLRGLFQAAVKAESSELRARPGATVSLRLRNDSALPFRLEVRQEGGWLRPVRPVELRGQSTAVLAVSIAKDVPAGNHAADLLLEATNCHVAPGRRLQVRLPVRVLVTH